MIIYRVENEHGHGPYNGTRSADWMEVCHEDRKHPGVEDDVWYNSLGDIVSGRYVFIVLRMVIREDYLFGFRCMEELNDWFSCVELMRLQKLGFEVHVLDAQVVFWSSKQCIFRRL